MAAAAQENTPELHHPPWGQCAHLLQAERIIGDELERLLQRKGGTRLCWHAATGRTVIASNSAALIVDQARAREILIYRRELRDPRMSPRPYLARATWDQRQCPQDDAVPPRKQAPDSSSLRLPQSLL